MKRSTLADEPCPVARAAVQLVDAWSFVILRELFLGNRRFESLRTRTRMSPRSLARRLVLLAQEGIVEKTACAESPAFSEYRLSAKGLDLWPLLALLRQWGERWAEPGEQRRSPFQLLHRGRGHELRVALVCADCGEPVDARSGEVRGLPRGRGLPA